MTGSDSRSQTMMKTSLECSFSQPNWSIDLIDERRGREILTKRSRERHWPLPSCSQSFYNQAVASIS